MVRISVLVDNNEADGFCSEWGLSLYVQRDGTNVLLDFGQSDAFEQNAEALGIDLAGIDFAVLSHAHYDHADGMEAFFQTNDHAPLYLSGACAPNCWSTKRWTSDPHYIGIRMGLLERYAARLVPLSTSGPTTLAPGIHAIPHTTPGLKDKGKQDGMLLRSDDEWEPDDFLHEVTLAIELGSGKDAPLAAISSCSHAGPLTIVQEVMSAFPKKSVTAYVGGLHLFQSSDKDVLRVAHDLGHAGINRIYTGHCTGDRALELLHAELPGQVTQLRPGMVFEL